MSVIDNNPKIGLFQTLKNALALNANFYEYAGYVSKNQTFAQTTVILAAISYTLGSSVVLFINRATILLLILGLIVNAVSIVLGYYFWTWTIWKVGQWLKPAAPSYRDLLIPIGFAYAPQVLNFLTVIPLLGRLIELILAIWSLLAVIVAVRQGLDISTQKAALICLLGWPLIQIAISFAQLWEQRL